MSLNELTAAVEADMMKNSITSTRNGFNLLALQVHAPHAHPAHIHTLHCILSPARLQFGFIVMFAVAWELGPLLMILTNIFQAPCPMPHPPGMCTYSRVHVQPVCSTVSIDCLDAFLPLL